LCDVNHFDLLDSGSLAPSRVLMLVTVMLVRKCGCLCGIRECRCKWLYGTRLSDGIGRGTVVPVMDVGRVAMLML
jgi:hypothetical protein